jgi:hypothetical protein
MCTVLAQGLDLQHQVWSAERDRGQAASLYRDDDWELMRSRLLSGLKAIHLVCTAGVVDEEQSIRLGLSTLQKACTMSAVRFLLCTSLHVLTIVLVHGPLMTKYCARNLNVELSCQTGMTHMTDLSSP